MPIARFACALNDKTIAVSTPIPRFDAARDTMLAKAFEIAAVDIIGILFTFPLVDCIDCFKVGEFASKIDDGFVKPFIDIEHGVSRYNLAAATVITTLSIDTVNTSDDTETNNKWTNLYIIPIVIFVIIIFVISGLYCCNNNKIVPAENIIEPKTIYSYGHVGSPNFETSNDYSELERKNTEQNGRVKLNPVYSQ